MVFGGSGANRGGRFDGLESLRRPGGGPADLGGVGRVESGNRRFGVCPNRCRTLEPNGGIAPVPTAGVAGQRRAVGGDPVQRVSGRTPVESPHLDNFDTEANRIVLTPCRRRRPRSGSIRGCVHGALPCLSPRLRNRSHSSEWRNRQTRQLEGLVPARAWGFKSPLRHDRIGRLRAVRPQVPLSFFYRFSTSQLYQRDTVAKFGGRMD